MNHLQSLSHSSMMDQPRQIHLELQIGSWPADSIMTVADLSWRLLIWFSSSDESPSTTRSIVQFVWNTHSSGSDSVEWLSVADSPTMETSVRMFFVSSPQEIFLDNTLLVYFWMVPFIHHKLTVEEKHTGSFRSPLNRTTRKANKPPQRLLLTKQNQHFRNLKRNN